MKLKNQHLFLISMLMGTAIVVAPLVYDRLVHGRAPKTTTLTPDVEVTAQIAQRQLRTIQQAGYKTLIDFRPDSEVDGQASSKVIEREAQKNALSFFYVPIPHGDAVPEDAVRKLSEILSSSPPPFLLYCRSGRRATRAWSLAEASRRSGRSAEGIYQAASGTGYSIEDLKVSIKSRVSRRDAGLGNTKGGRSSGDTAKK
ncbi:beta-lactamase hydrolase domain-containing protein [Armatimonas sp.]|uniref:beta-lactamase hydrolase domain-containing protein n=1 Tax=Armatimonas sp. TaxID=1872638 RepID=UPI0037539A77